MRLSGHRPDVIIFDGVCGLCTRSVRFILAHEASDSLRFASLQSPAGSRLLRELGIEPETTDTFVLLSQGMAHTKSDAALRVAGHLRPPWRWLRALRIVPKSLRDGAYDFVAGRRYRWFGRLNDCMMPTAALAPRFLNE